MRRSRFSSPAFCRKWLALLTLLPIHPATALEIAPPFGDNMVLQQQTKVPVWGTATANVTVTLQSPHAEVAVVADKNGEWRAELPPVAADDQAFQLRIFTEDSEVVFDNVIYGEVWICAGQSNMRWSLNSSDDSDLEMVTATADSIRWAVGPGRWLPVSPDTAADVSAVAWHFAMTIHRATGIPVGLVRMANNSASAEAWMDPQVLAADGRFEDLFAEWAALELPNTGQAVTIDVGEPGIHPSNKAPVGRRLARLALDDIHGVAIQSRSPTYAGHTVEGSTVLVRFENVGDGIQPEQGTIHGFMLAGENRIFYPATARRRNETTIELEANQVSDPAAVRYGWADNPEVNVTSSNGLPLTPFRTDDWDTLPEQ